LARLVLSLGKRRNIMNNNSSWRCHRAATGGKAATGGSATGGTATGGGAATGGKAATGGTSAGGGITSNCTEAERTLTGNGTGQHCGYTYEYWKDTGTGSLILKADGYSVSWNNINNLLGRKGIRPGSANLVVSFDANYQPNGNSYLCVYGWTDKTLCNSHGSRQAQFEKAGVEEPRRLLAIGCRRLKAVSRKQPTESCQLQAVT